MGVWFLRRLLIALCIMMACGGMTISAQEQDSLPTIKELQQSLVDRGYVVGTVDGVYGPNTATALKEFQRLHTLKVTGFLNTDTASALRSAPLKKKALLARQNASEASQVTKSVSKDDDLTIGDWLLIAFVLWVLWMIFKGVRWFLEKLVGVFKPEHQNSHQYYEVDDDDEEVVEMEDDELAAYTIEISTGQNATDIQYHIKTPDVHTQRNTHTNDKKHKAAGDKCWVPKGHPVTISGVTISRGMVYVGSKLRAQQQYHGIDNCLINTNVKVARNTFGAHNDQMPYWPSYSDIPPKHRRLYLEWLADGARDPSAYVGYVFLYFYGLERRLFLDQSKEDAADIVAEISRLLIIYGSNHSISRYLGDAVSFSSLILDGTPTKPSGETSYSHHWELPMDVRLYLGNKLKQGLSLSNADMLKWYLNHPNKHLRTPATRLEKEFIAMMKVRLDTRYPDGPKIRMPKRNISVTYSASSSSFSADLSKLIGDIPDVAGLSAPIKATQKIADDVMNELDKLSRYLGRNPDGAGSAKATSLLPKELIHEFGGDYIKELQGWILAQLQSNNGAVTLAELIDKSTEHNGTKITKTIHKDVEQVMRSMGWNMLPAHSELIGTLKSEHKILLLPDTEGGLAIDNPSVDYQLAIFELALGSYIAHADTRVLEVEVDHLSRRVEDLSNLSKVERDRLHNYVKWLAIQKTDFGAIKRKLKTVDHRAKGAFANISIAIAAADGQIVPAEVKVLEAIYKSMGLDQQDLYSSLHSMSGAAVAKSSLGENAAKTAPIALDMDRVSATLHDTQKASTLLASIFEDDEPELNSEPIIEDLDVEKAEEVFPGLDGAHTQLLQELLERDEWPRADFELLAGSLKLMADGAMETINEWAFDLYDDAIIEDDDPLTIYRELISEETD